MKCVSWRNRLGERETRIDKCELDLTGLVKLLDSFVDVKVSVNEDGKRAMTCQFGDTPKGRNMKNH